MRALVAMNARYRLSGHFLPTFLAAFREKETLFPANVWFACEHAFSDCISSFTDRTIEPFMSVNSLVCQLKFTTLIVIEYFEGVPRVLRVLGGSRL